MSASNTGLTIEPFTFRTVHKFESENVKKSTIGQSSKRIEHVIEQQNFENALDGLRRGTTYVLIVQAFNSKGAGPASHEVSCETFAFGKFFNSITQSRSDS